MYMYYLLGHRIAELPIDDNRKEKIAMNTFILALDGDINFRPQALRLVVDLMKKNKKLGAACGRIHPIGTGPMVWYQVCCVCLFNKIRVKSIECIRNLSTRSDIGFKRQRNTCLGAFSAVPDVSHCSEPEL